MTKELDRITLCNLENEEGLEKKGKVKFKLHVKRNEGPYMGNEYIDHYFIIGKLSNGEVLFDQSIPQRKLIGKDEFLKEVNDDLVQMNCYLSSAEYHKRFPIISLQCVKGVLYKEKAEKKESGDYWGEKK